MASPSAPHGISDYLELFTEISEQDREVWDLARQAGQEILAEINGAWERAEYPVHLVRRLGELDLLTEGLSIPGHRTLSALGAGLVAMELSHADGSIAAAAAVQGGLALRAVEEHGSPQQRQRWVQELADGTVLGAFALTEPDHGSDSVAMETAARRDGDAWVLDGQKKWIGNGASGGITLVFARSDQDGQVKGFVVPQDTAGYSAEVITGKGALRAIHQSLITLESVRVAEEDRLPGVESFQDVQDVLVQTRVNVGWSALGHTLAMAEAALEYAGERIQFGVPLAAHQMVQERLAQMLEEVTAQQLRCIRTAQLQEAGRLRPAQASLLKYANTRSARRVGQIARDLLGGNGILLEHHVIRHLSDVEAIHTYEGTESIQALMLGRDLTGVSAFAPRVR